MKFTGIWYLADIMGTYTENIQFWMLTAKRDLEERGLIDKFDKILGLTNLFGYATIDISEMDRQLTALALAISTGSLFVFLEDGLSANDWIINVIQSNIDSFVLNLNDYLAPMEVVLIKDALKLC